MKYYGEGSLENPQFPLQFIGASGAITVCHNEQELNKVIEKEDREFLIGFASALLIAVIGAFLLALFVI